MSFLIYHPLPSFSTLLSILPKNLPRSLKFLHPYRERLQPPSGDVVQHAVTTNAVFFDTWTTYILKSCKWRFHHEPMLSYWTIRIAAAIESQLEPVKAGGAQAQRQREEDVTRKITGILEKALSFHKIPSMIVGCYIIMERLVLAANLSDVVVLTFMEAIVSAATEEIADEVLMTLFSIAQKLKIRKLPPSVFRFSMKSEDLMGSLVKASSSIQVDIFATCLALEIIEEANKTGELKQRQELLQLLDSDLLSDEALETTIRALINPIRDAQKSGAQQSKHVQSLIEFVQTLGDSAPSLRMQKIIKTSTANLGLNGLDGTTIEEKSQQNSTTEKALVKTKKPALKDGTVSTKWIKLMPTDDVIPSSYLPDINASTFDKLAAAFDSLLASDGNLEEFLASSFLDQESAVARPTFISFFVRYWSLPFPRPYRATAIRCVAELIGKSSGLFDFQHIFPYVLVALAETSEIVREAAVSLVLSIHTSVQKLQGVVQTTWNSQDLYGIPAAVAQISPVLLQRLLQEFLIPDLEEYKMDHLAIGNSIRNCLNGSSATGKENVVEKMKKSSRATLLAFLAGQAQVTPILRVRVGLLELTSGCVKAGKLTRLETFRSILESWIPSSEIQIHHACMKEKLDAGAVSQQIVKLVPPSSTSGSKLLQELATTVVSKTSLDAILDYVVASWPSMEPGIRYSWATLFFDHGVLNKDDQSLAVSALDTLRSLQLSTDILEDFLKRIITPDSESAISSPSIKRRKTANGAVGISTEAIEEDLKSRSNKIATLLELIRNADHKSTYRLLPGLFQVFQELQRSKSTLQNELTYVHWLLISCLREIVERTSRTELKTLDYSDIRVDLIVDTLTHTVDPQTQYAALMLLSFLAKLEPELIIYSMMPVFTFMGNSILKQDDDHATFVVDQTINAVIPPLIESFKQQKGGALPGASGLILSFVAAFEHIIPSRRLDLFSALISRIGPEDYLFVLFVVLKDRYGDEDAVVHDFISTMLLRYSPIVQFKVCILLTL